ncbi:hypothetical protein EVAR_97578_1 [Eumeta japonica]|uniref:Uncharacterized protein n=1 Tax=Eumeta variegata TaxID=151549 RepID=A0A4C1WPR3_EUMVA|nr:hypothetical protein EVAR_97578_1 [Eumeta japonica]
MAYQTSYFEELHFAAAPQSMTFYVAPSACSHGSMRGVPPPRLNRLYEKDNFLNALVEVGNALVPLLGLRVSMVDDDYLVFDGSQARLQL